ncbi:hypothetical protein C2845_PM11G01820 [Panicum miliaceum]|uniref:Secreted protein n=1 Tax=Panicum miliaceum TaxID=4540 RepID=A0A3L6RSE8_PANMI|nr:hypothetical protein C2845_PM11G01820 [Panicum miliaceum]
MRWHLARCHGHNLCWFVWSAMTLLEQQYPSVGKCYFTAIQVEYRMCFYAGGNFHGRLALTFWNGIIGPLYMHE